MFGAFGSSSVIVTDCEFIIMIITNLIDCQIVIRAFAVNSWLKRNKIFKYVKMQYSFSIKYNNLIKSDYYK